MRNGYSKFIKKIDPCVRVKKSSHTGYDFSMIDVFSVDDVKRAMKGEAESLWSAFEWRASPMGYNYWRKRAEGYALLSDEDLDYLKGMYDYARWYASNS